MQLVVRVPVIQPTGQIITDHFPRKLIGGMDVRRRIALEDFRQDFGLMGGDAEADDLWPGVGRFSGSTSGFDSFYCFRHVLKNGFFHVLVNVAELILLHGEVAIVDDEDLPKVAGYLWYVDTNGYVRAAVGRDAIYLHRLVMGSKPGQKTDHRFHNKLDNRKSELRKCNQRQNMGNARTQVRPKSSVFKGVSWHTQRSKWLACIKKTVNGKKRNVYLGVYTDEVSAARAYNAAALEHFGAEFALLNPV